MPIYEYYCPDNHTIYQFYAKTLAEVQTYCGSMVLLPSGAVTVASLLDALAAAEAGKQEAEELARIKDQQVRDQQAKTAAERKKEAALDPVVTYPRWLIGEGILDEHAYKRICHEIDVEIDGFAHGRKDAEKIADLAHLAIRQNEVLQ